MPEVTVADVLDEVKRTEGAYVGDSSGEMFGFYVRCKCGMECGGEVGPKRSLAANPEAHLRSWREFYDELELHVPRITNKRHYLRRDCPGANR